MKTTLVLDVSNLAHRAYHTSKDAANPVATALDKLERTVRTLQEGVGADGILSAVDSGKCFRHRLAPEYKSGRPPKDAALQDLLAAAPERFSRFGAVYASEDHEADDVMATLADRAVARGGERLLLVTDDGDALASIYELGGGAGAFVLRPSLNYALWGTEEVLASKYGVYPWRVPTYKALAGDASDGIRGVPFIGPVSARRLAGRYANPAAMFRALQDPTAPFTKAERTRLTAFGLEASEHMLRLTTPVHNAPLRQIG